MLHRCLSVPTQVMKTCHPELEQILGKPVHCIALHTKRLPNQTLLILNYYWKFLLCDYRTELFLELLGLDKKCEQRITESLTELFFEFYS